MSGISAVIIAQDEESRIAAAVGSVRPWVDEVLVLDGGSEDQTVAVAAEAGARVERFLFDGFVRQKQRATDRARFDLQISIDADERVDEELGRALRELTRADLLDRAAWRLRRLNYLDGRPLRASGWYPDRRIRVFDRRRANWDGTDPHDFVRADGSVGDLPGHLHHDPTRTVAAYRAATIAHAERGAVSLAALGRRPAALTPALHGAAHLARKVVLSRAWRDGRRGWTVAWVGALGTAHKYRRARELVQ